MSEAKPKLTARERQVVRLVLAGEKRSAIAVTLSVAVRTVDFHLVNIRRKAGVNSIVTMAVWGTRLNGELDAA